MIGVGVAMNAGTVIVLAGLAGVAWVWLKRRK